MATSNEELRRLENQATAAARTSSTGATSAATTPANTSAASTSASAASPYAGLSGLSGNTSQQLGQLTQGYRPSQSVTDAQDYLNSVINNRPGEYQSQYQNQLDSLYGQIMNRDPFTFDLNGDLLYQQYRDQYINAGRQAMMDTMGQAAALTGGYGNSYASTAGNQAYQGYLQQLNEMVPSIYQMALDRYNQEGSDLMNRLSITQDLEDAAYGRYRDTVSDWNSERDYANSNYWNYYNADYGSYQDMLNYYSQLAQLENQQWSANREYAYNYAMNMLNNGLMPDSSWLEMAGISQSDANEIQKANKRSSGGSSSSRRSSGGGSSKSSSSSSSKNSSILNSALLGATIGAMGTKKNTSNAANLISVLKNNRK